MRFAQSFVVSMSVVAVVMFGACGGGGSSPSNIDASPSIDAAHGGPDSGLLLVDAALPVADAAVIHPDAGGSTADITCGPALTCTNGDVCCVTQNGQQAAYACQGPNDACQGVAATCGGPSDCTTGACCGSFAGQTIACAPDNTGCGAQDVTICTVVDDCGGGGMQCCATPFGMSYCADQCFML